MNETWSEIRGYVSNSSTLSRNTYTVNVKDQILQVIILSSSDTEQTSVVIKHGASCTLVAVVRLSGKKDEGGSYYIIVNQYNSSVASTGCGRTGVNNTGSFGQNGG